MADSDDEYDRRRGRDKFKRERSDYQDRREDRPRRDDWPERDSWSSSRSRRNDGKDDYVRNRRSGDRYSPGRHELSPPVKRMRRDWDYGGYDAGYPAGGGVPWGGGSGQPQDMAHFSHGYNYGGGPRREMEQGLTQPPMMTFKQFLASQDDGIDDQEAVKKYGEYKLEFKQQQLNEFFVNHKEEEWFKSKYHPEECDRRKTEQRGSLQRRLEVFQELLGKGWIDGVTVNVEKSDQIVRMLDAVVILLEGGNEYDLNVLDEPPEEEKSKEDASTIATKEDKDSEGHKDEKKDATGASTESLDRSNSPKHLTASEKTDPISETDDKDQPEPAKKLRRRHSRDYSYDENESSSDSDSEPEPGPPGLDEEADSGVPGEESETETKKRKRKSRKNKEASHSKEPKISEKESNDTSKETNESEAGTAEETDEVKPPEQDDEDKTEEGAIEEDSTPKPRALHKTCSIFLRNLAPSITKQEVEAMCKRYPGFLRVAIADPQTERRFFRRGWVTFERTVNIKEICWNLNNIRLRDCELGAIVNRDLSRRIRSVNGIASHKQVVMQDIKLAAKIIQNLDSQRGLWVDEENKAIDDHVAENYGLTSKNPLLKNITDYLIEEASAEEEELLGLSVDEEKKENEESGTTLEKDPTLLKVLDRLLLYLRIVHSIDYYNHSEYPCEDEMPNRCGIMHARGSPPSGKVTQKEISDYISHFEQKITPFMQPCTKISNDEAVTLGKKDPETEVEKFIQANTQELAKDKWLCPLSGKKFKSPEFVRKHILNKHGEKIEEVKKEVDYFNNYLLDPKRPQLPEHPANRSGGNQPRPDNANYGGMQFHPGFAPPPMMPYGYGRGFPGGRSYPDMYNRAGYKRNNYGGRSPRGEPRKLITYRDLDAPTEVDFL